MKKALEGLSCNLAYHFLGTITSAIWGAAFAGPVGVCVGAAWGLASTTRNFTGISLCGIFQLSCAAAILTLQCSATQATLAVRGSLLPLSRSRQWI